MDRHPRRSRGHVGPMPAQRCVLGRIQFSARLASRRMKDAALSLGRRDIQKSVPAQANTSASRIMFALVAILFAAWQFES